MSLRGSSSSTSSKPRDERSIPLLRRTAAVVLALVVTASCRGGAATATITVGAEEFQVEVARTAEERRVGLMDRDDIPERGGMLFVFPENDYRSFWMKDTSVPLSIAFISPGGVINEIYDMEPFSLERIESRNPAQYALEVRRGTFAAMGIRPGDRVGIPEAIRPDPE